MRHGPLPPALRAPRWSALTWVLVAAAAGAAACAIAGLYPQFDEGRLRWLLGLTSAPLAACVVGVALRRRTALGAALAALGLAAILGVASTLFPLLALSFGVGSHGPDPA